MGRWDMYSKTILMMTCGIAALGLTPAQAAPPTVGACLPLASGQGLSKVAPVDCNTAHTAEVMGVLSVPKKVWRSGSGPFWAWAYRKCHTAGITYVWGNEPAPLPVSSYALPVSAVLYTYEPNKAQIRTGERWVACVGVNSTATGKRASRTGSIAYSGLAPTLCVSTQTWRWQDCAAPASAAMTNVVWLKGYKAKYPGTAKAVRMAEAKCAALGSKQGLSASYWYVPGKRAWKYGDHFGYCNFG